MSLLVLFKDQRLLLILTSIYRELDYESMFFIFLSSKEEYRCKF